MKPYLERNMKYEHLSAITEIITTQNIKLQPKAKKIFEELAFRCLKDQEWIDTFLALSVVIEKEKE